MRNPQCNLDTKTKLPLPTTNIHYAFAFHRSCGPTVFTYLLLELCGLKQRDYVSDWDSKSKIQTRSHVALKHGREAKRGRQNCSENA